MQIFQGKSSYNLYELEFYIHDWNVRDPLNLFPILKLPGCMILKLLILQTYFSLANKHI